MHEHHLSHPQARCGGRSILHCLPHLRGRILNMFYILEELLRDVKLLSIGSYVTVAFTTLYVPPSPKTFPNVYAQLTCRQRSRRRTTPTTHSALIRKHHHRVIDTPSNHSPGDRTETSGKPFLSTDATDSTTRNMIYETPNRQECLLAHVQPGPTCFVTGSRKGAVVKARF
jgi:hypothetical protein